MRYGIKHNDGVILAISAFENDLLGVGFIEITQAKYEEFLSEFTANPFSTYSAVKNELVSDETAFNNYNSEIEKSAVRGDLRRMSVELDLMIRLGESTTALQAEFDALKITYDSM